MLQVKERIYFGLKIVVQWQLNSTLQAIKEMTIVEWRIKLPIHPPACSQLLLHRKTVYFIYFACMTNWHAFCSRQPQWNQFNEGIHVFYADESRFESDVYMKARGKHDKYEIIHCSVFINIAKWHLHRIWRAWLKKHSHDTMRHFVSNVLNKCDNNLFGFLLPLSPNTDTMPHLGIPKEINFSTPFPRMAIIVVIIATHFWK